MDVIAEERAETQRTFDQFEGFLYDVKTRFESDESIFKVTTEEELAGLRQLVADNLFWLLNKTHKMPLTSRIIADKAKQVNETVKKVFFKARQLPKREPAFQELWAKIEECQKSLNETWPVTRPWMPEKKRNSMQQAIDHAIKYYHIYREQQGNRSNTEIPGVRAKQVRLQTYYLEMTYNHTLRTTKNPPTPKPAKTKSPYYKVYNNRAELEADMQKGYEKDLFGLD
jgi:hypothetical protein